MTFEERYTFQFRRGTPEQWEHKNTILKEGEPGFAICEKNFKIGDGITPWNDLEYFLPEDQVDILEAIQEHIDSLTPHPIYDDGPSFDLLYQNAKV